MQFSSGSIVVGITSRNGICIVGHIDFWPKADSGEIGRIGQRLTGFWDSIGNV
jgi:hypothetical protein